MTGTEEQQIHRSKEWPTTSRQWPKVVNVPVTFGEEEWRVIQAALLLEWKSLDDLVTKAVRKYLDEIAETRDYRMALHLARKCSQERRALNA